MRGGGRKVAGLAAFALVFGLAGCTDLRQPEFIGPESLRHVPQKFPSDSARRAGLEERRERNAFVCDPDVWTEEALSATRSEVFKRELISRHTVVASETGDIEGEKSGTPEEGFLSKFQTIMQAYEQSGCSRILIYINGGLNPKDLVLDQAAVQVPYMLADGYYPVFLVWQTGGIDTYFEQISQLRNGRHMGAAQWTTPLYLAGDVGEGIIRSPITLWNSVRRYLESTLAPTGEYLVADDHAKAANPDEYPDYRKVEIPRGEDDPDGFAIGEVFHALKVPVRLATAPFLDSMGKTAWENMLRRTRTTVRTVWEVQREFRSVKPGVFEAQAGCFPHGTGVFAKFFQALEYYNLGPRRIDANKRYSAYECGNIYLGADGMGHVGWSTDKHVPPPTEDRLSLTVIGHSMGTMVLNELIPSFSRLPYENIVYLAAAASIRDFDRAVPWVIRRKMKRRGGSDDFDCGAHFYSLMLHPLAEARERSVKGLVLSGSLLEWIDDIYQEPKTMLDRTLGMWRNVRPALHVFEGDHRDCMHFRVFAYKDTNERTVDDVDRPPGLCNAKYSVPPPQLHGGFNDTDKCYWQARFWNGGPGS